MFNATGSEKAFIAMGTVVLPLTVLIGALLAYTGLGEMPDPIQIRDSIVYFLLNIGIAYGVWRVPNAGYVNIKDIDVTVDDELVETVAKKIEENPV